MAGMDGERLRDYWSAEVEALLNTYSQFARLIPAADREGAAHAGEDGRYVEDLIRAYLRRFLPQGLEVLTGFILRPAVKTGTNGRERRGEQDAHSGQLDILVVDTLHYPVFQRFGESVIVPPEGVIAIVSVKKHLRDNDIQSECLKLRQASDLCRTLKDDKTKMRGPFLALIGMKSLIAKIDPPTEEWIFKKLAEAYTKDDTPTFDNLVGFVGALETWSIFKRRPNKKFTAGEYVQFAHGAGEKHLGLQLVLSGVLSVLYDDTRSSIRRPGFTGFPPDRPHDKELGKVRCNGLR